MRISDADAALIDAVSNGDREVFMVTAAVAHARQLRQERDGQPEQLHRTSAHTMNGTNGQVSAVQGASTA